MRVHVYGEPDFANLPQFRPPPRQGSGMDKAVEEEYLNRLKGKGAWPELGRMVNELYDKGGHTSYSLEKATGLTALEINMYSTSARVLGTILEDTSGVCEEGASWAAESGDGMSLVYELRVLSAEQRPRWLALLYEKGDTDAKEVRAFMKVAKDVERRPAAQRKGFDVSLPGDTLACGYSNYALKVDALEERLTYLKRANKYAQSEGCRARLAEIQELVVRIASGLSVAGSPGMSLPFLPLAALGDVTELARVVPYTEDMSCAGLRACGQIVSDAARPLGASVFGSVTSEVSTSMCSVPSSIPISKMTNPVAIGLPNAMGLCAESIPVADPMHPLLILVDRDQKTWGDVEEGREYYLCRSDGSTAYETTLRSVRQGKPESDEDIIGLCLCVFRPPLPDASKDGYVSDDDWYE